MAIFLTGSTGYIGAHIASILLQRHSDRLNVLVRAKTEEEANERLWHALQLHMNFPEFLDVLETRISIFRGDLTDSRFGLETAEYARLVGTKPPIKTSPFRAPTRPSDARSSRIFGCRSAGHSSRACRMSGRSHSLASRVFRGDSGCG